MNSRLFQVDSRQWQAVGHARERVPHHQAWSRGERSARWRGRSGHAGPRFEPEHENL